jgi:hypothetical protein
MTEKGKEETQENGIVRIRKDKIMLQCFVHAHTIGKTRE